jgi:hypothetical protein
MQLRGKARMEVKKDLGKTNGESKEFMRISWTKQSRSKRLNYYPKIPQYLLLLFPLRKSQK